VLEGLAEEGAQLLGDGPVPAGDVELAVAGAEERLPHHPHHRLGECGQPLSGDPCHLQQAVRGQPGLDHPGEDARRLHVLLAGHGQVGGREGEAERGRMGTEQVRVDAGALGDVVERVLAPAAQRQLGGEQGEPVLGGGAAQLLEGGALATQILEQLDAGAALRLGEPVEQPGGLPPAQLGVRFGAGRGAAAQQ
jgi:hypothetical protein